MKFIFLIQGEGRGHITQAVSLNEILITYGHEICEVFIGRSSQRKLPEFLLTQIKSPVKYIQSPNFFRDSKNKGIKIFISIIHNLLKAPVYISNLKAIYNSIIIYKPDVLINFNELHGGLLFLFYRLKIAHYCIGHQYFFNHPNFKFPVKRNIIQHIFLKIHTRVTSIKATKIIALSYYDCPDIPKKKLFVVPPLIRREIKRSKAELKNFLTGYILNSGYSENIIKWHSLNSHEKLIVFWDENYNKNIDDNLIFYQIEEKKFIESIISCKGLFTTAGFESICEALYLGKPVLINPVQNHYEQDCNAFDAAKAGAGIIDYSFNISKLLEHISIYSKNETFKEWCNLSDNKMLSLLCR